MLPMLRIPGFDRDCLPLGLGTLGMGTRISERHSHEMLDTFVAAGGAVIDTAAVYCDWMGGERRLVERLLGRWLRSGVHRDSIYLVTKGCHPEGEFDLTTAGARVRPEVVCEEIAESLTTLGVDRIDLWYLHRDDPAYPVEPIIDVLNEQVRQGRIGAFGASNWSSVRIQEANTYASKSGLQGFFANQMMWSLGSDGMAPIRDQSLVRMDAGMKKMHADSGMFAMPYSSLANGYFSKVFVDGTDASTQRYDTPENRTRAEWVRSACSRFAVTPTIVCLHTLWNHTFPVVPLVGPSTVPQLEDCLAACQRDLIVEPCQ